MFRTQLGAAALAAVFAVAPLAARAQTASADRAPTVEEVNRVKPVNPLNLRGGVAVKGYDPVAYFTDGKAVKGDPAITSAYQGATYRFASAAHRDLFAADPARYAPQYGGYCAFAISNNGIADIDPHQFAVQGDRLYLNNNVLAQKLWSRDRPGHIAKGDAHWSAYPKSADAPQKFGDDAPA